MKAPGSHGVRRWLTTVAAVVAAVVASAAAPASAAVPNPHGDSYLVVFKDNGAVSTLGVDTLTTDLAARYDAEVSYTYRHALRGFAAKLSANAARRLAAEPGVASVEPNRAVQAMGTQLSPPSWGLDRIDQRETPLDGAYTFPNTGSGVTAYIIDSGIRITHTDFAARAVWGINTVDGNNSDCAGHGTHVAGTVGGHAYGVAKAVRLVAVKVLNCAGSGTLASVVAGVDWVTAQHTTGPAVATMSFAVAGSSPALENAVRASIADGVVYAVAAGNSNADACGFTPARIPEAITVGALDTNDARASFSNFGACTDIYAPGANIRSPWNTSNTAVSTISGTSMATAHAAGAAALILSANSQLLARQVAIVMLGNATGVAVSRRPGLVVFNNPIGDLFGPKVRCLLGWGPDLQFNTAIVNDTPSIVVGGPSQLRMDGWVRVVASGTIAIRFNNEGTYSPNGSDEVAPDFNWPGPHLRKWSLVGAFGASIITIATIQVSGDSGCMQVPYDTYLRLWMNDDITNDNQGQWAISVDYHAPD